MSPPAGRYSGDYPRRWLGGDHPRLPRWPQRRGFTRRPEGDAAGSPGQSSRPGLLGLADLVVIVPEDLDQPLAVARVDRELARKELGVGAGANGEGGELDQLRRRPGPSPFRSTRPPGRAWRRGTGRRGATPRHA